MARRLRRKEAGFYGVMALIMAGVLVLVSLPAQSVSSTESSSSPAVCDTAQVVQDVPSSSLAPVSNETQLSNGTVIKDTYYPTFFLTPNSTGVVCYTYFDNFGKTTLDLVAGKNYLAGTYGRSGIVPLRGDQLNVTANPSSILVQPGRTETVAYTLTAGNSTGLFQAMFPPADCVGLPVFIGSGESQVNATAYSQLAAIENWSCSSLFGNLEVQSISIASIRVVYVGVPA